MKRLYIFHWLIMGLTLIGLITFIIFITHKIVYVRVVIEEDSTGIETIVTTKQEDTTEALIETTTEPTTNVNIDTEIETIETEVYTETDEITTEVDETTALSLLDIYTHYDLGDDAIALAKIMWTEAGGIKSTTEKACVAWVVLNRADLYGTTVYTEITKDYQFAWKADAPVQTELLTLAYDVLARWYLEKETGEPQGRVLPADYYFFYGDGKHNHFFQVWGENSKTWDYSLPSPYAD